MIAGTAAQAEHALAAREARARRRAEALGYRVLKSRRPESAGTFGIIEARTGFAVLWDREDGYGYALEEVEAWLADDE